VTAEAAFSLEIFMRAFSIFLFLFIITVTLLLHDSVKAESLSGKTMVYTTADGAVTGHIFIGPSGRVYWTAQSAEFGTKNRGQEFQIGRNINVNISGCQSQNNASMSGNTLALGAVTSCPSLGMNSTDDLIATFSGNNCNLTHSNRITTTQSGTSSGVNRSDSCRISAGNQIAR
jgi:hypothetical protein